ncbi:chondroitin sulfate synthase 2 [Microplitis demolitor]|uniref:chondroitin sulfate synthase 2 n=1 Tax=Microplitis demolitor TaxID=69319 RepID=UPI00043FFE90|nr:chondroitin sulfate synthase 2 [Microplitis demolitor]
MRYLSKMSVCCRKNNNNGFIIGMCFGLIISLLLYQMSSIDSHDDKYGSIKTVDRTINKKRASHLTLLTSQDNDYEINNQINRPSSKDQVDEYAPKIKKPSSLKLDTDLNKKQWRFIRPRYYFTELGIREKLFLGVLTNPEHLHSRGVVFNRTVGHLIEKIRYFITINEGSGNGNKKPNVTLSGIVGFTDTRKILKPFHVIKYIIDNYLDDYDYYFIIKDSSYVNARQLMALIESFSIGSNKEIYLGIPIKTDSTNSDNYINDNLTNFCSLDAGILISNSIMRELKKNLDWCVKNTLLYSSQSDDVNFGRCLYYSTKIPCSKKLFRSKNEIFAAKQLPNNFNFVEDFSSLINNNYFDNLVSVYPIYDPKIIYRMHAFVAAKELEKIENAMMKLRNEISASAHLGPVITGNNFNSNRTSWPVGINPGNKAPGRFDILRWNYFNATHIFGETDFSNVGKLQGSKKLDIEYVLMVGRKRIKDKYDDKYKYEGLVNGYMRFDASRGMDYILDLSFVDSSTKESNKVVKRIELCKPLGKVELLAAPYVTENTRVNLILMVDGSNIDDSIKFVQDYGSVCMEKRDKTTLMLVFLYNNSTKGANDVFARVKTLALSLTNKYNKSKEQSKIIWLSIQLPKEGNEDPRIKVAVTDLIIKKFSLESLILFVQTRMELTVDYLNRIRMNTIIQWQVFSPIPFVEYNPNLYESDQKSRKFDLSHNHGYYDTSNYESISFYAKDYRAVRRASENELPQVHSDREISKLLKKKSPKISSITSIFKLFVSYSNLHIFRGIEPALKIHYSDKNKNVCGKTALGHRGQLARLIDEYKVI